jgi:hypothetical protein
MVGGAWKVRQGLHPQEEPARAAYKRAVVELLA